MKTLALDLARLKKIKADRARRVEDYFRRNAGNWEDLRGLYVDDEMVDDCVRRIIAGCREGDLLDIGTGTGRVLRLAGPCVRSAVGIDNSPDMLAIARTYLDQGDLRNCQVRHGDMYRLPFPAAHFDIVSANMLIRYADDPGTVVMEGARVLRPGGLFIIVDFAPHQLSELREEHAHRWLGFSEGEMTRLFTAAALAPAFPIQLEGDPLTVCIWTASKPADPAYACGTTRNFAQ